MKTFDFTSRFGTKYEIFFERGNYVNGNLAVATSCREEGEEFFEDYGNLTVNLIDYAVPPKCAFLDTNNVPDLCDFAIANGWCKTVGSGRSGFCTYPLVEFTDEFLGEICEEIC